MWGSLSEAVNEEVNIREPKEGNCVIIRRRDRATIEVPPDQLFWDEENLRKAWVAWLTCKVRRMPA